MQPFSRYSCLRLVQDRRVLGDHVRGVALLAAGVEIFRIIERPEPVLVAAVAFLDRIQRAAISAVARRAAKFFQRMKLHQVRIGMAGERRVVALRQAKIGLGERHRDGNDQRVRADVAGLAAIDEARAAKIVERRPGGIHVDLAQMRMSRFFMLSLQSCRVAWSPGPADCSFTYRSSLSLRVLGRLVDVAALGDQRGLCGHDRSEQAVQLVVAKTFFCSILPPSTGQSTSYVSLSAFVQFLRAWIPSRSCLSRRFVSSW